MLRGASLTLPTSLMGMLVVFRPCFTAPTFRTFCALGSGLLAQTGRRTVCGMLTGAGLARCWSHHRAHRFFSHAGYDPGDVDHARAQAPWYRTKAQPSVADMLSKLRRVIITTQFRRTDPQPATPTEINILRLAWADIAA